MVFFSRKLISSPLFLFTIALSLTSLAPAQQPAADTGTTLKVQVREVVLPVTVRDKKGQIAANLRPEDFILTQDGRPQTIKSFARPTNLPFRLGLLVDTSRSQQNALTAERTASGKFVDQMLGQPTDKAFLLHFDREVELLQDFTGSKDKLHRELDEMTTAAGPGPDSSGSRPADDGDDRSGRERRGGRRAGTQMYDAIYLAANELMQKEPGRKAMVLVSDGVDRGSKETLSDAVDAAEKANVSVYTVYFKGEEEHRDSPVGMGRRGGGFPGGGGGYPGGGGGYPGGGRGGQRPSETPEARTDGKKVLEQLAARTGGRFFEAKKKDSFEEVYAQITEELRGQYLMTYTPDKPPSKDEGDGFHKILLKAKDENLTVITREGYYAQE